MGLLFACDVIQQTAKRQHEERTVRAADRHQQWIETWLQ
jgi:hypothetical protein